MKSKELMNESANGGSNMKEPAIEEGFVILPKPTNPLTREEKPQEEAAKKQREEAVAKRIRERDKLFTFAKKLQEKKKAKSANGGENAVNKTKEADEEKLNQSCNKGGWYVGKDL